MGFQQEMKKLEQKYEKELMDILVLLGDMGGGAVRVDKGIWEPSVNILAYIDLSTQELVKCKGRISWLAEEKDRRGWIYHLKNEKIYHLRVRKSKQSSQNPAFLLAEVVKRNVKHPDLQKVLEEYRKPLEMEDELCGTFSLERSFGWFTGTIDWLGEECSVSLECDEEDAEAGTETAKGALAVLHMIYGNLGEWDEKFRSFAAEQLTELANDWLSDSEDFEEGGTEITKEAFAKRIEISEMTISPDGNYEVYYNDDDMFWGHVIIVSGNTETGMEDAQIAG